MLSSILVRVLQNEAGLDMRKDIEMFCFLLAPETHFPCLLASAHMMSTVLYRCQLDWRQNCFSDRASKALVL